MYVFMTVIDKKLDVQKIDLEVNIVDCLTKSLPDHCLRTLRRQMRLVTTSSGEHESRIRGSGLENTKETNETSNNKLRRTRKPN